MSKPAYPSGNSLQKDYPNKVFELEPSGLDYGLTALSAAEIFLSSIHRLTAQTRRFYTLLNSIIQLVLTKIYRYENKNSFWGTFIMCHFAH